MSAASFRLHLLGRLRGLFLRRGALALRLHRSVLAFKPPRPLDRLADRQRSDVPPVLPNERRQVAGAIALDQPQAEIAVGARPVHLAFQDRIDRRYPRIMTGLRKHALAAILRTDDCANSHIAYKTVFGDAATEKRAD